MSPLLAALVLWWSTGALAHPLAPASLHLAEAPGGAVEVRWRSTVARSRVVRPVLPDCPIVVTPAGEVVDGGRAVESTARLDCGPEGLVGRAVGAEGLEGIDVVVRVSLADGRTVHGLLHGARDRFVVPPSPSLTGVLRQYLGLGAWHLAAGLDHVLFVLGLAALVPRRRLLHAVTAFTVGHSASLAATIYGWIRIAPGPVEVAIAASLVVLALEVCRAREGASPSAIARWPWALCAPFGLLHGLGFAGALREIGIPADGLAPALIGFNLGLEVAQIALVALALGVVAAAGAAGRRRWPDAARALLGYTLGGVACMWMLERLTRWLG